MRFLRLSSAGTRLAVGIGVSQANAKITRRFSGMQSFCLTPLAERQCIYSELSDLELNLRSRNPEIALGVGLYRIWLADVFAGRRQAAELLGEELTELSRSASCHQAGAGNE